MTDPLPNAPEQVETYRARRRLQINSNTWREPGELVPEAHGWPRVESYLHTGWLEEAKVSPDEFAQAVQEHAPEQKDRLFELAGLSEGVVLQGPHKTPRAVPKPSKSARKNTKRKRGSKR